MSLEKGSSYMPVRRTFFHSLDYFIPFIGILQAKNAFLHFLVVLLFSGKNMPIKISQIAAFVLSVVLFLQIFSFMC